MTIQFGQRHGLKTGFEAASHMKCTDNCMIKEKAPLKKIIVKLLPCSQKQKAEGFATNMYVCDQ